MRLPGSHDLPEDEFNVVMGEHVALRDEPGFLSSAQLHPPQTATTVKVKDGQVPGFPRHASEARSRSVRWSSPSPAPATPEW